MTLEFMLVCWVTYRPCGSKVGRLPFEDPGLRNTAHFWRMKMEPDWVKQNSLH